MTGDICVCIFVLMSCANLGLKGFLFPVCMKCLFVFFIVLAVSSGLIN